MQDIIIVGASGFGREILSTINEINRIECKWNVLGFIDDNTKALDGVNVGYQVLGTISDWKPMGDEVYAMGIANPRTKELIANSLKKKEIKFASIIHPTVSIGENSELGEGIVIFGYSGISVNVKVGDFVFLNAMVGVGHDAVIGNYCTLGPKCCVSGYTEMGKGVNMGALASTYPGIRVGDYATIGMNSAAIRRVKPNTTVMGVPAKLV